MFARSLALALVVFTVAGCRSPTDNGRDCIMTKRGGVDGGRAVYIMESEIKEGAHKDFISFGSTDCENLTCVRDYQVEKRDGGDGLAHGYCSDVCIEGTACPAENADDDNKADKKLSCRALLLDSDTLGAFCKEDPVKCRTYFGGVTTPFFCARGTTPDGGGI
jgi:hypothetical protein